MKFHEPPILEELEINPKDIGQKIMIILNPFGHLDDSHHLTKNPDLAGPIFFYFLLSTCSFLSGNQSHFGFIYGIAFVSSMMMFCFLTALSSTNIYEVKTVGCILGYSVVPIVALSAFGIIYPLRSIVGVTLATLAVIWSSLAASRLFVAVSGRKEEQPLIAYPCAVLAAIYVLLVIY